MAAFDYSTGPTTATDARTGGVSTDMGPEAGGAAPTDMGAEDQPGPEEQTQDFESLTQEQIEAASTSLRQVDALRPGVWQQLDDAERLAVLQDVENRMAEIQGRPAVAVRVEPMPPGVYGGYARGRGITLSQEHLESNDTRELLDSIVHEGRHAYQDCAIQTPGFVADSELIESWRGNWDNYLTADEYGQELYESQPIERDAWQYAARIAEAVLGTGR